MSELQTIYEQADLLYDLQQIDQALDDLAEQIHQRYAASKPLFLCAMNGAVMTAGNLLPKLTFPL
jgi:hypoxanthine phosphoribosyltransferase